MQYIILFILFIVFPICGIQAILEGDTGLGLFFFFPIIVLICGIVFNYFIAGPNKKRQEAVRKMYGIPDIVRDDYGSAWDREFDRVIKNAIDKTSDPSKLSDLQNCQRVVKQMKGSSFRMINNTFRLTGCRFTITDSEEKKITQIV